MTNLQFSIDKNGVANLVFDLPNEKINKLSAPVLLELEKALNVIDGNKAIRLLLISSAKQNIFIAGADINEIKDLTDEEDAYVKVAYGQKIMDKIADLKIPSIAIINGACMGGGLELALSCTYRLGVVNNKTSLALPEVNLGVIPGFGGTQRLPKLVGLEQSLNMILSGKAVDANKAYKIGLVDDIVREEFLEEKISHFASEILTNEDGNIYLQKRKNQAKKRFIFETLLLKKYLIYYFAKKNLMAKTKGNYPAPLYALEVIKRTYGLTYSKRGYEVELNTFCELVVGKISKNLIDIFFTNEALKKDDGVLNSSELVDKKYCIRNASLVGAGIMGGGIAWLFAYKDINIRFKDITQNAIMIGYKQISKIFADLKKIRKLTKNQVDLKMGRVTSGLDYSGFIASDIVVEAVVENMAVKKTILTEIESKIRKDALIASNTSSLSITEMSHVLKNPERFAGMHFFNPVNRMPLVEIIKGEKTSDETIVKLVRLSKKLGKTPIVVKDVAGFLVNRILLPFMNEAAHLFQEGIEIERIDNLLEDFGMPMGPFVLADVVGIDVGCKVAISLEEAYGSRMKVAEILREIYQNHKDLLGKKTNSGFYSYISSKKTIVNPKVQEILTNLRKEKSLTTYYSDDKKIVDRCILIMCNEAAKCLEEGVVDNARYLDMAMIMGAGFPAFRGGLLKYIDNYGIQEIVARLKEFEAEMGERFKISELLLKMADSNEKFYN